MKKFQLLGALFILLAVTSCASTNIKDNIFDVYRKHISEIEEYSLWYSPDSNVLFGTQMHNSAIKLGVEYEIEKDELYPTYQLTFDEEQLELMEKLKQHYHSVVDHETRLFLDTLELEETTKNEKYGNEMLRISDEQYRLTIYYDGTAILFMYDGMDIVEKIYYQAKDLNAVNEFRDQVEYLNYVTFKTVEGIQTK